MPAPAYNYCTEICPFRKEQLQERYLNMMCPYMAYTIIDRMLEHNAEELAQAARQDKSQAQRIYNERNLQASQGHQIRNKYMQDRGYCIQNLLKEGWGRTDPISVRTVCEEEIVDEIAQLRRSSYEVSLLDELFALPAAGI